MVYLFYWPAEWASIVLLAVVCCRPSSSSVVVCNAAGGQAGRPPGAWAVGRPTLHCGPVWLRPIRATPCLIFVTEFFYLFFTLRT